MVQSISSIFLFSFNISNTTKLTTASSHACGLSGSINGISCYSYPSTFYRAHLWAINLYRAMYGDGSSCNIIRSGCILKIYYTSILCVETIEEIICLELIYGLSIRNSSHITCIWTLMIVGQISLISILEWFQFDRFRWFGSIGISLIEKV